MALCFYCLPKAPMGKMILFAVKTLPFVDISAGSSILAYAYIVTRKNRILAHLGGIDMRHFYFRLILGIVFIGCMIFSFVTMNIPFAILYLVLGGAFLISAYSLWKKDKDNRR